MGHGFTWETQDREQDIAAAQKAWASAAKAMLADDSYRMLVFDEMSYMFKYGYLEVEPVVEALRNRPKMQNVMITGRSMARELKDIADTISVVQDEQPRLSPRCQGAAGHRVLMNTLTDGLAVPHCF